MPPEWMWPYDGELEAWFGDVKRKHDAQRNRSDDDEDVPLVRNELGPR